MAFTHLHVHTQYSLLDGSNKIKEYVAKVKKMGMTAATITDHGVMYGVIDFYRECKANGINPVLGCELYVAPHSRFDRETSHGDDRYYHLILLAENDKGYANLMKIVSVGFVEGYYYKPRVDFETLQKYHEGLICLSACLAGEIPRLLVRGLYEDALEVALRYRDCFGEGNYFLELQDHGISDQQTVNQLLVRMSKETGIPLVCTNDCHYTEAEDAEAHDALLCIQTGKTLADEDRMRYEGGQYYVKSEEEMRALFPYAKEACDNTQKIADRCHVEIEFGVSKLPHYEVPEGYDSYGYLHKLCMDGLTWRYGEAAPEHEEQLEYELSVIKRMGYVDYFLIVWDFINYARTHGIPVGPGRGSAAGSIVSYAMGITSIDPVKYALLFERFLNPERVSMPDIDIDFDVERRGEVIDYVVRKYGKECVTQIVTFGTLKARGVIRDVGRVQGFPYAFVDTIAKAVPDELGITIAGAMEKNPELARRYETEEDVRSIIDTAKQLEGLPRQAGVHAAGVVIAQRPMDEFVPLARSKENGIVTQFTMTTIEELGLLKMDFLGLRNLTVIDDAIKMVKENYDITIDFDSCTYDDPKVFEMISAGNTTGVFQLESPGMTSFMKELCPQSLEDIIAGISLYRPGPMDSIPNFIRWKNDPEHIVYDCPELEPILKPTYGCIVYQEQVMQIVRDLAGYSMGRSDLVRRAMSKKKMSVMQEERQRFVYGDEAEGVKGCVNNGISEEVANHIFDELTSFAAYAFNKSHAASYAFVAYQTAFLKLYYPKEFMAAQMTSFMNDTSKIAVYIASCRKMGITVMEPDVNKGRGEFVVSEGNIRYGMYAVKGVGTNIVNNIVKERERGGEYTSLENFISRLSDADLNKRVTENLIKAGAMDGLPGNRAQKVFAYTRLMDVAANERKNSIAGQMSLFDIAREEERKEFEVKLPDAKEFDPEILLSFEKEVLGIYVSGHPLEKYVDLLEKKTTARSVDFMQDDSGKVAVEDNVYVTIGGMITEMKPHFTKNNQQMAFVTIEDLYGTAEVIVFPKTFEKSRDLLKTDARVFVTGRTSVEEEADAKLLAQDIVSFDGLPKTIWLRFDTREDYEREKDALFGMLPEEKGKDELAIFVKSPRLVKRLGKRCGVTADDALVGRLKGAFGEDNIKVVEN